MNHLAPHHLAFTLGVLPKLCLASVAHLAFEMRPKSERLKPEMMEDYNQSTAEAQLWKPDTTLIIYFLTLGALGRLASFTACSHLIRRSRDPSVTYLKTGAVL